MADYYINDSIYLPIAVTDRDGAAAVATEIVVTVKAPDGSHLTPLTLTGGTVYVDAVGAYHTAFSVTVEATVGRPYGWKCEVSVDDGTGGTWVRSQQGTLTVARDPSA